MAVRSVKMIRSGALINCYFQVNKTCQQYVIPCFGIIGHRDRRKPEERRGIRLRRGAQCFVLQKAITLKEKFNYARCSKQAGVNKTETTRTKELGELTLFEGKTMEFKSGKNKMYRRHHIILIRYCLLRLPFLYRIFDGTIKSDSIQQQLEVMK